MNVITEWIVLLFILSGTALSLFSSIGLLRLPDVYTRSHASTKTTTIGLISILAGGFAFFLFEDGVISVRLILAIIFVFLTAPVAGHLTARSAHRAGVQLADISVKDELREDLEKHRKEMGGKEAAESKETQS